MAIHPWVKKEIAVINLSSSLVTNGLQSKTLLSYWAFIIIEGEGWGRGENLRKLWRKRKLINLCCYSLSKSVKWKIWNNLQFAQRFPGRLWGRKKNSCLPSALILAVVATFSQVCLTVYKKQVVFLPLPCYQHDCKWVIKSTVPKAYLQE